MEDSMSSLTEDEKRVAELEARFADAKVRADADTRCDFVALRLAFFAMLQKMPNGTQEHVIDVLKVLEHKADKDNGLIKGGETAFEEANFQMHESLKNLREFFEAMLPANVAKLPNTP